MKDVATREQGTWKGKKRRRKMHLEREKPGGQLRTKTRVGETPGKRRRIGEEKRAGNLLKNFHEGDCPTNSFEGAAIGYTTKERSAWKVIYNPKQPED